MTITTGAAVPFDDPRDMLSTARPDAGVLDYSRAGGLTAAKQVNDFGVLARKQPYWRDFDPPGYLAAMRQHVEALDAIPTDAFLDPAVKTTHVTAIRVHVSRLQATLQSLGLLPADQPVVPEREA